MSETIWSGRPYSKKTIMTEKPEPSTSPTTELARLHEREETGAITKEEYEKAKKKLLE